MNNSQYVQINKYQCHIYDNFELYLKVEEDNYILYKKSDIPLGKIHDEDIFKKLFYKKEDKGKIYSELKRDFSVSFEENLNNGNIMGVRKNLEFMTNNMLNDVDFISKNLFFNEIKILTDAILDNPKILEEILLMTKYDYLTGTHSVNVMALSINYCIHNDMSFQTTMKYGIAALFHDIGKNTIPLEILEAPRKLTNLEFSQMKTHPGVGRKILLDKGFDDEIILNGCYEHHMRMDGSGYPQKVPQSDIGKLLGIIDIFEALTNDKRLYREAIKPFEALKTIKNECIDTNQMSKQFYNNFINSLKFKNFHI